MTTLHTLADVSCALAVSEEWVRTQVGLGAPHVRDRHEVWFSPSQYEHLVHLIASSTGSPRCSPATWRTRARD